MENERDLYGVMVPANQYEDIQLLSVVFVSKTFPGGKLGKKEAVIYAAQVLQDWMERVLKAEGK